MLAVVLALQACVAPPAAPPRDFTPKPVAGDCGSAGLQGLVGQSARVLETMRFGVVTRIIRPDMPVTQDYSATRLNIRLDTQDIIKRVDCG
jgi:hypothetical protein